MVERIKTLINKDFLSHFLSFICANLFFFTLHLIYEKSISVVYFYKGFFNNFSVNNFLLSYFMFLILLIFNFRFICSPKKASEYVMLLLFFVAYSPSNVLFSFGITDMEYFIFTQVYWLFLTLIIWWLPGKYAYKLLVPPEIMRNRMSKLLAIFSCSLILFVFIKYAKFSFMLELYEVSSLRLAAREYPMPRILVYLFGFARAAIPLFLGYTILNKRWKATLILLLILFCDFSVDGSKSVYFITIFVLVVSVCYNSVLDKSFAILMFLGVAISHALSQVGFGLINDLIVRRVFFVPQQISYCYYDYIQNNVPNYYNNLLRFIGLRNFKPNISFLVGELYFNDPVLSANTGLIGDAFWNLGKYGIVVFPLMIGALLYIVDLTLKNNHSNGLVLIVSIIIVLGLLSSSLFTVLLTHGLFFQLIVLFFLPNTNRLKGQLNQ